MSKKVRSKGTSQPGEEHPKVPLKKRILGEIVSWAWVIAAFFFIQSTLVQARVIPSSSMEDTLLIGDHLLVSRAGYDIEIPFTRYHWSLWREPQRQQVVVFRPPFPGSHDYIKRIIGLPGDRIEIKQGVVWVNGKVLVEPYVTHPIDPNDHFPYESVTVPEGHYYVMGDNRRNSYDSRFWGFVPREGLIGSPMFIYMSLEGSPEAWQPGHIGERIRAYGSAIFQPRRIRWSRLFTAP